MEAITQWLKKTVEHLVDPEKEERVQTLIRILHDGIRTQRQAFSLSAALRGVECSPSDVEMAREEVFRRIAGRGWADGKLTPDEREVARWVAERLELPDARAQEIHVEFARRHFGAALAQAMDDGILDAAEEARLREIAGSLGWTLAQFARQFFQAEGEAFLRGVFLACVADGQIKQGEWNYLLTLTQKLGIAHDELLRAIQPQAQAFVERVLAEAKADGRLTRHEEATLRWLLDNLGLAPPYRQYVSQEVGQLRALTDVAEGRLPSLPPPTGIGIRSGEIVHLHTLATWREMRVLKSGTTYRDHQGSLTLTDNRLLFSSVTKTLGLNLRKIVSHRGGPNWIEVQVEGKPASVFCLAGESPLPCAIFTAAVAMANQTLVAKSEGQPARHIPRDVRQRVWQRYGGRCAECGAADYIEFDHIVPVARGGSSTDNNVQLLCRRCNLKKSDNV